MKNYEDLIRKVKGDGLCNGRTVDELAIGFLRYEALRKLNAHQFTQLHLRNIAGQHENFDEMVDELVLQNAK